MSHLDIYKHFENFKKIVKIDSDISKDIESLLVDYEDEGVFIDRSYYSNGYDNWMTIDHFNNQYEAILIKFYIKRNTSTSSRKEEWLNSMKNVLEVCNRLETYCSSNDLTIDLYYLSLGASRKIKLESIDELKDNITLTRIVYLYIYFETHLFLKRRIFY